MTWPAMMTTGIALAMDAFAVCIASSVVWPQIPWRRMLRLPIVFALFQAGMPVVGWLGLVAFRDQLEALDHWIAFGLLAAIGGQMILASRQDGEVEKVRRDPLRVMTLLALGFATSVDAAVAGVSIAVLDAPLGQACAWIGLMTFALCLPAVIVGRSLGPRLAQRAELCGGLLLIGLGVKIVVEHTTT